MPNIMNDLRITYNFVFRKKNLIGLLIPLSMYLGAQVDRIEAERLSLFRDKSALFGREVDKPSWP